MEGKVYQTQLSTEQWKIEICDRKVQRSSGSSKKPSQLHAGSFKWGEASFLEGFGNKQGRRQQTDLVGLLKHDFEQIIITGVENSSETRQKQFFNCCPALEQDWTHSCVQNNSSPTWLTRSITDLGRNCFSTHPTFMRCFLLSLCNWLNHLEGWFMATTVRISTTDLVPSEKTEAGWSQLRFLLQFSLKTSLKYSKRAGKPCLQVPEVGWQVWSSPQKQWIYNMWV